MNVHPAFRCAPRLRSGHVGGVPYTRVVTILDSPADVPAIDRPAPAPYRPHPALLVALKLLLALVVTLLMGAVMSPADADLLVR